MKILGIESSCDETACAVVEDGRKVLSNIVATSLEEHKLYGGVVPEIASRRHAESISGVVKAALEKLREAAKGTENLMPYLIDAVKTYATLGEICGVLREEFGEYKQSGSMF